MTTTLPSPQQLAAFGAELDNLRAKTFADLGQRDEQHIKRIIRIQRFAEVAARACLQFGIFPPLWLVGTILLSLSKILENMEIGHNVMHGQYDWMNDPAIHSSSYEWDMDCDSRSWKSLHNYRHHIHTNILGKDKDYGYGILRMDENSKLKFHDRFNLLKFVFVTITFQYGVAMHELGGQNLFSLKALKNNSRLVKAMIKKASRQVFKDYIFFPALAIITGSALSVLAANFVANMVRNIWASSVIFCGHFSEGHYTFKEGECLNESRGQWYFRQTVGSCNFTGSRLLHIMSGHLSYQIEHHLFPDLPTSRYTEISVDVRDICRRYNVPYNNASMARQYFSVVKKVFKNSFRLKQPALAIA